MRGAGKEGKALICWGRGAIVNSGLRGLGELQDVGTGQCLGSDGNRAVLPSGMPHFTMAARFVAIVGRMKRHTVVVCVCVCVCMCV